jgi:bifunctional non-homologous end joining protein LigD
VCDNAATLVYLANQNCVTLHTWLSRMDKPGSPDQMIFDLDPPEEDFEPVRQGARRLKSILDEIGLKSYLKTTGSRGLHVVVPLNRTEGFEAVRSFAQHVASIVTAREPDKYTSEQHKEKRQSRLFIDTLRNSYGHTTVAPYSVRARSGAPVAIPLPWDKLSEKNITASFFNIRNIFKKLADSGDAWKGMERQTVSLSSHRRRLEEALKETSP